MLDCYTRQKEQLHVLLRQAIAVAESAHCEKRTLEWQFQADELFLECYNIAIVGNMKRGKSTLLNALLGRRDDLISPVASKVCTSAIIRYRNTTEPEEYALLYGKDCDSPRKISMEELADYITESGNPGNRKEIRKVEVYGHFPLLGDSVHLIDTPGRGSVKLYHDTLLEEFLPLADAIVLLFSADLPVEQSEYEFLELLGSMEKEKLFYVVTKWDELDNERDRQDVVTFIESQIARAKLPPGKLFRSSANVLFQARKKALPETEISRLKETSGMAALENALEHFILEKSDRSLSIRRRTAALLASIDQFIQAQQQQLAGRQAISQMEEHSLEEQLAKLHAQRRELPDKLAAAQVEFDRRWQREIRHFKRSFLFTQSKISDICIDRLNRGALLSTVVASFRLKKEIEKQIATELNPVVLELTTKLDDAIRILSESYRNEFELYAKTHSITQDPASKGIALSALGVAAGAAVFSWTTVAGALTTLSASYQTFLTAGSVAAQTATANGLAGVGFFGVLQGWLFGSETAAAAAAAGNAALAAKTTFLVSAVSTLGVTIAAVLAVYLLQKLSCSGLKLIQNNRIPDLVENAMKESAEELESSLEQLRKAIQLEVGEETGELLRQLDCRLEKLEQQHSSESREELERTQQSLRTLSTQLQTFRQHFLEQA